MNGDSSREPPVHRAAPDELHVPLSFPGASIRARVGAGEPRFLSLVRLESLGIDHLTRLLMVDRPEVLFTEHGDAIPLGGVGVGRDLNGGPDPLQDSDAGCAGELKQTSCPWNLHSG